MITVKEAVAVAERFFKELYDKEGVYDLMLEEVEFDKPTERWLVTLGFSRQAAMRDVQQVIRILSGPTHREVRGFKTFEINAHDGEVLSMKIRNP